MSLVTKSVFLAVAIILAHFGIHKDRPFLLHCVEENSTLLDTMMDNKTTLCTNLTSCFSEPTKANKTDISGVLGLLEQAEQNLGEKARQTTRVKEANKLTLIKEKIGLMREELQTMDRNPVKLTQKVRVCGKDETTIGVVTLSSLVSLLVLAALATYQLHKITDYKVGLV